MQGLKSITSPSGKDKNGPFPAVVLPLSAQIEISDTGLQTKEPDTQNWRLSVPQDASLFLAGAYASHLGAFVQVTYNSQDDHFTWDNTDIRYANTGHLHGKSVVYGVDINNNPSVEDLWNDTPAWGFPWINSPSAPGTAASALIDGQLAQDVAGVGIYAMWNNHLYVAGTAYTSAHLGQPLPNMGTGSQFNIQDVAPLLACGVAAIFREQLSGVRRIRYARQLDPSVGEWSYGRLYRCGRRRSVGARAAKACE